MSTQIEKSEGPDVWYQCEVDDPENRDRRLLSGVLEKAGVKTLSDLPLVTKHDIVAAQKVNPPFGNVLACDPKEVVRMYVGAGPETTFFTTNDLDRVADHGSWAFWTNGFRASDVIDNTINYHWVIAGTLIDASFRRIGCAVIPGGVGGAKTHLENIRWCGVTGLFAFPTFLDELALRADEEKIDPSSLGVRRVGIAGEIQSPGRRAHIEKHWNLKVREMYGGAEVPFVAAECDSGGGMHLNPQLLVEILDPETWHPVPSGSVGVVVVSDPQREAMPMLRYVTGDLTAGLTTTRCDCGRSTPRLGPIIGRIGGVPRVKGLFLVQSQIQGAISQIPGLGRWQVVIDRPGTQDTVELLVEGEAFVSGEDNRAPIVAARFHEATRLSAKVTMVRPGGIPATADVFVDRRNLYANVGSSAPHDGSEA